MEQFFDSIMQYVSSQSDPVIYTFLFVSSVVENIFPPIPGDTITAFGAFFVGSGRLSFILVYLTTTLGSVTGFMALFFFGRYLERQFFIERDYKFFSANDIIAAEKWFVKYNYFIIAANRFLPGLRSVISLVAGITKCRVHIVLICSFASASIWNLLWILGGYLLGNNWEEVKGKLGVISKHLNIAIGLIIILVIAIIIYKKKKRKETQ